MGTKTVNKKDSRIEDYFDYGHEIARRCDANYTREQAEQCKSRVIRLSPGNALVWSYSRNCTVEILTLYRIHLEFRAIVQEGIISYPYKWLDLPFSDLGYIFERIHPLIQKAIPNE